MSPRSSGLRKFHRNCSNMTMSSDHIIVASLIGQGKIGKGDVAEIVGDEVVQALPHLIGAAVGQGIFNELLPCKIVAVNHCFLWLSNTKTLPLKKE